MAFNFLQVRQSFSLPQYTRLQRSSWITKSTRAKSLTLVLTLVAAYLFFLDAFTFFYRSGSKDTIRQHSHLLVDSHYGSYSQYLSHTTPPSVVHDDELEELGKMVARTNGYLARDYSLSLGWNNVRYIIEAAILEARILNRTLILPSFVYARSCEYNITICANYATMVDRGDAVGSDEWRYLPPELQVAWRLPITVMLNVTHLRRYQPVILVSDYLRLHDIPIEREKTDGSWDRSAYHSSSGNDPANTPDLFVIENHWFDPTGIIRVDSFSKSSKRRGLWTHDPSFLAQSGTTGYWSNLVNTPIYSKLQSALPENRYVLEWEEARALLESDLADPSDDALQQLIEENGWEVVHTFGSVLWLEYTKSVVERRRQVAARDSLRSFFDDYGNITASVILLAGETHLYRKPGTMRFSSPGARDEFARIVLHAAHPPDKVLDLAERLSQRMTERSDGHLWMGAHMRRGDFVRVGWAMESEFSAHLNRIKNRLDRGREVLRSIITQQRVNPCDIPDAKPDYSVLDFALPPKDYRFYLATDERDPSNLDFLSQQGAVLTRDLLTVEDRQDFGWPLMLTDVLALVEQAVLMHSAFFYGHAMSSVTGGIVNMRAANGADPRTALVD